MKTERDRAKCVLVLVGPGERGLQAVRAPSIVFVSVEIY